MKKNYTTIIFLLLTVLLGTTARAVDVTFNVTVPEGTREVYIIGSSAQLGDWGANEGRAIALEKSGDNQWTTTIALTSQQSYSYMFLCGQGWIYEESPNVSKTFTTSANAIETRNNVVSAWNAIPAKFNVTVPTNTENVYIIGDNELGDWQADLGFSRKMSKTEDGLFTATIPLSFNANYDYQYLAAGGMAFKQMDDIVFSMNTATTTESNDAVTGWESTPQPQADIQHFLSRKGNRIVDAQDNEFLIRSIGLGNYMVWEPYMWKVENYEIAGTMKKIVERMSQLLNPDDLEFFVSEYMNNYMTKADVDSLKAWGFNGIRLPMHYNLFINSDAQDNTFIERGFELAERVRQWCAANEMYLILDLHAAPGGQGYDTAIADSEGPALWEGDEHGTAAQYQTKMVLLWKEIAKRFSDKDWIGGYDLLNETNYSDYQGATQQLNMLELYRRCVNQIRIYDQKNIIYLEGNGWANDFSTIRPNLWGDDWDENMAYSPHKYWASHNIPFSGEDIRAEHNVPLFLGETGENSNEWFYQTVKLAESKNIGWAWWSYKKIDNMSGFTSITPSESFQKIIQYINSGTGMNPAEKEANFEVFLDFLNYVKLENCEINYDVMHALIGQQQDGTMTKPYGPNKVPGVIHASGYDMGRNGFAYNETSQGQVLENIGVDGQNVYNAGWTGRNDAVDIEKTSDNDPLSNGYNIGWTNTGEWVQYTLNAEESASYHVRIRISTPGTPSVSMRDGSNNIIFTKQLSNTQGWQNWETQSIGYMNLLEGTNTIRLYFNNGEVNFNYLIFEKDGPLSTEDSVSLENVKPIFKDDTIIITGNTSQVLGNNIFTINGTFVSNNSMNDPIYIGSLHNGVYILETQFKSGNTQVTKFIR